MGRNAVTPDVPLPRFANACWWLLQAMTQDDIIEALTCCSRELTGVQQAYFAARHDQELTMVASSGVCSPDMARSWSEPVGQGIVGTAVEHGTTVLVREYGQDERRLHRWDSLIEAAGIRSAAVIPVRRTTEVIGALCLMHGSPVEPDRWPVRALELLVRQAVSQLDIAAAAEAERLVRREAEAKAEDLRKLERLTGLVAHALMSDKRLGSGLDVIVES
ncbi:MAG: GAF domain-containing protein, partial [Gemmatimonadales bacterium]